MNNAEFGWELLLDIDAPSGCSLKAALFTTYDRPDECFLVEEVLPTLLKIGREPDGDGVERQYFLVELDRCLNKLHGKLVVVSSTVGEEPGDAEEGVSVTYGWVRSSIRMLTVGSRGKAVQHAKLWMLQWEAAGENGVEYLEIVVSSTNLTRAAFKGQIQAAWRVCVELHPQGSRERLARWGLLPEFLRELAGQAGDGSRLDPFVELLARADCPEGVSFVASVPGKHSREALFRTPWGEAGLRAIMPSGRGTVRAEILTPFVGSWSADALGRWCARFEGRPDRLRLIWIDKHHPWALEGRWRLSDSTLKAFTGTGACVLHLRHEPDGNKRIAPFLEEHRPADQRWSHAKVYSFRRGNSRRLLLTSANFSPAAWGRESGEGELIIDNFELGVCIEQAAWPFNSLEPFENEQDVATVSLLPVPGASFITWAEAVWDGKNVSVQCRCVANRQPSGELDCDGVRVCFTDWSIADESGLSSALVPWSSSKRPLLVELTCEQQTLKVPIFDDRPQPERENTIPPGVDEDAAQTMRDELLFEQYGGWVAAEAESIALSEGDHELDEEDNGAGANRPDSYSVPAFDLARRYFCVVDTWAGLVRDAATLGTGGEFKRQVLQRDGELLVEAFRRQADRDGRKGSARAIGARLAAEELIVRLTHFLEA